MCMAGARVQHLGDIIIRKLLIMPPAKYCTNHRFDSMRTDRRCRYGSIRMSQIKKKDRQMSVFFLGRGTWNI